MTSEGLGEIFEGNSSDIWDTCRVAKTHCSCYPQNAILKSFLTKSVRKQGQLFPCLNIYVLYSFKCTFTCVIDSVGHSKRSNYSGKLIIDAKTGFSAKTFLLESNLP
jgi:hypothetical protein